MRGIGLVAVGRSAGFVPIRQLLPGHGGESSQAENLSQALCRVYAGCEFGFASRLLFYGIQVRAKA